MDSQPFELLAQRLDRLERQNRSLRRAVIGLVCIVVVCGAAGAITHVNNNCIYTDRASVARVEIGIDDTNNSCGLELLDATGKPRIVLAVPATGPATFTMYDSFGQPQTIAQR